MHNKQEFINLLIRNRFIRSELDRSYNRGLISVKVNDKLAIIYNQNQEHIISFFNNKHFLTHVLSVIPHFLVRNI